ncbi:MAG: hypothetical protein AAGH89_15465 [Verrucomicrobiota bacterium]
MIVSRNDNYGGNLLERSTYCLQSAISTFDEVFYVDWNSPTNSLLEDVKAHLSFRGNLKHIVVSPAMAESFLEGDQEAQRCCEVLGRNIGIRRATGDWIVSTNIDIIMPERKVLVNRFQKLDEGTFYTVARRDVTLEEIAAFHGNDELNYSDFGPLQDHLVGRNIGPRAPIPEEIGDKHSLIDCCGDFQMAHRNVWNTIRGFEERFTGALYTDTNVQKKAWQYGHAPEAIFDLPVFHIDHGKGSGGLHESGSVRRNDIKQAIYSKAVTTNGDDWGFSEEDLEIEIL